MFHRFTILALGLLAWGVFCAQAQPTQSVYKGHIVSAEDGKGVDNAILQFLDAGGKMVGFTFSGSDGSVSVAIPQRASTRSSSCWGIRIVACP